MRFMVIVKANADTEAGVMPSTELREQEKSQLARTAELAKKK